MLFESNKLDLCISCNEGYYPKIDDIPNNNSFIDCYKNPDGYYLENNIYKPCYPSCNRCLDLEIYQIIIAYHVNLDIFKLILKQIVMNFADIIIILMNQIFINALMDMNVL